MRLTVSQSVSQTGRQAVNEACRHAGRNTQLHFFGVSLHLQMKKKLNLQPPTVVEWENSRRPSGPASVYFPDRLAGRVMVYPSAVLQTEIQIPLSTNF